MIRGAVAMALVLNIKDDWQHKELIVSSTIMLIISSTLVFGSTTALAGKFLLGENKHDPLATQENDSKIVLEYVKNDQPNE
jgi:NhaP-type Na+/H+ or K+/H+ antiporter|tara:strand:+ start:586 stop:828 length:243 start_codon:yes stop_codon:yes gene_type:complete